MFNRQELFHNPPCFLALNQVTNHYKIINKILILPKVLGGWCREEVIKSGRRPPDSTTLTKELIINHYNCVAKLMNMLVTWVKERCTVPPIENIRQDIANSKQEKRSGTCGQDERH